MGNKEARQAKKEAKQVKKEQKKQSRSKSKSKKKQSQEASRPRNLSQTRAQPPARGQSYDGPAETGFAMKERNHRQDTFNYSDDRNINREPGVRNHVQPEMLQPPVKRPEPAESPQIVKISQPPVEQPVAVEPVEMPAIPKSTTFLISTGGPALEVADEDQVEDVNNQTFDQIKNNQQKMQNSLLVEQSMTLGDRQKNERNAQKEEQARRRDSRVKQKINVLIQRKKQEQQQHHADELAESDDDLAGDNASPSDAELQLCLDKLCSPDDVTGREGNTVKRRLDPLMEKYWQPLKLNDILDSHNDFKRAADVFFDAVGVQSIFSSRLAHEDDKFRQKALRLTVDSVMMRLYELRTEVGLYINKTTREMIYKQEEAPALIAITQTVIEQKKKQMKKRPSQQMTKYMCQLLDTSTVQGSAFVSKKGSKNETELKKTKERKTRWYALVIRNYMHRTMNELRYIETQVFQVHHALMRSIEAPDRDPVRLEWKCSLKNLFDKYLETLGDESTHVSEEELLEFLKRIVYKLVVCAERLHFFKTGEVRARDDTMSVFEARVPDRVVFRTLDTGDLLNPFKEQGRAVPVNSVTAQLRDSQESDILREFYLRSAIYEHIKQLNMTSLTRDELHQITDSENGEYLKELKHKPRRNLISNSRRVYPAAIQTASESEEPNTSQILLMQAMEAVSCDDLDTVKSFANTLNSFKQQFPKEKQSKTINRILEEMMSMEDGIRKLTSLAEQLENLFGKDRLADLECVSEISLAQLLGHLPSVFSIILNASDLVGGSVKNAGMVTNVLSNVRQFVNGEIEDEAIERDIRELRRMATSGIHEEDKIRELSLYFRQQVFTESLPHLFEVLASTVFRLDDASGSESIKAFCELFEEKWQEQKYLSRVEKAEFEAKAKLYGLAQNNEMNNFYRRRLAVMVQILRSEQMPRIGLEQQKNIVAYFCEFLSAQIQDIRLRNDRSNIRRVHIDSRETAAKSEASLYCIIYDFLFAYFRWESNFKTALLTMKVTEDEKARILKSQTNSKRIIQQNSDQFVKMLFSALSYYKSKEQFSSFQLFIQVFYHLIARFNKENMQDLFQNRSLGRGTRVTTTTLNNLKDLLETVQQELVLQPFHTTKTKVATFRSNFDFSEPFLLYGVHLRYRILSNFCFELGFLLLEKIRGSRKIKEYRKICVHTWFIMLQNYIHMRFEELANLRRQNAKEQISADLKTENLFQSLIFFMDEAKRVDTSLSVLLPSDGLVMDYLRREHIPRLIDIVVQETAFKVVNYTRQHLLQFLFFYDEITFKRKRQDPNDPKLIYMLPHIISVAERLLQQEQDEEEEGSSYQKRALEWKEWLNCGRTSCQDCKERTVVSEMSLAIGQAHTILFELRASQQDLTDRAMNTGGALRQIQEVIDEQEADGEIADDVFDEDFGYTRDVDYNVLKYNAEVQIKFRDIEHGLFLRFISERQGYDAEKDPENIQNKQVQDLVEDGQSAAQPVKEDGDADELPELDEERMQQDKAIFMKDLTRSRHQDLVYRAYCHYYVIKKKCQYNVYEQADSILDDVKQCADLLRKVEALAPVNMQTSFMKTEIPFLTQEALRWIDKRLEEKRHDQVFIKNFRPKKRDLRSETRDTVVQLIQSQYYLSALRTNVQFFNKWLNQDAENTEEQEKRRKVEIYETFNKMDSLVSSIVKHSEESIDESQPQYCSYYHVQFFGRHFSPGLTYSPHGFVMRGPSKLSFDVIKDLLQKLFPDFGDKIAFEERANPSSLDQFEGKNEMGEETEEISLSHDQNQPFIVVCLNVEVLTTELVKMYGADNSSMPKSYQKGRANLSKFLQQNNKRYFCTRTSIQNSPKTENLDKLRNADNQITKEAFEKFNDDKDFWAQACQACQCDPQTVEALPFSEFEQFVLKSLESDNNDSQLCVLEVPYDFPTGFFAQAVSTLQTYTITNAHRVYVTISNQAASLNRLITTLKTAYQRKRVQDQQASFDNVFEAFQKRYSSDEIDTYISLFFNQANLSREPSDSGAYEQVLLIFLGLEELLKAQQRGLSYIRRSQASSVMDMESQLQNWRDKQEKWIGKLEDIRDEYQIDQKLDTIDLVHQIAPVANENSDEDHGHIDI